MTATPRCSSRARATTSCRRSRTAPTGPAYEDIALELGVTAQRPFAGGDVLPSTAWHPEFEDVNNDGFVDLFVAKGNVEAQVDYATRDPNNLLIGQPDGTFVEGAEAAGIVNYDRARGAALVDLNLDGMLDLVVVNRAATRRMWRNVGRGDADRAGSRWATGSRSGSASRRRTSTPSARGSRSRIGRPHGGAGGHRRRWPCRRASADGSTSDSATPHERRGPRAVARRRDRAVDDGATPTSS